MAVQVKHPFTSAKSDGGDATRIRPSNWNADHTITANTNSLLGTTGTTTVGEITCTAAGRALLDDADAAAQLSTLGAAVIPVGGSFDWWTDSVPAAVGTIEYGWLNGQAISRSTYSVLFALWGTLYGAGDGSTTFNVPDTRGRVTASTDDMGGASANRLTSVMSSNTLGATGGAQTHALSSGELASHTHGFSVTVNGTTSSDGNHTHTQTVSTSNGCFSGGGCNGAANGGGNLTSSNGAHTHTVSSSGSGTTDATGSGTAHNNTQPTIVCNKVVRLK